MATNRNSGPLILTTDSLAYSTYETEINDTVDEAEKLKLLKPEFEAEIITNSGVICDRPHGDNKQSVAKSYFGLSVYCDNNIENRRITDIRQLLIKVLALHYCIGEVQENAKPPTVQEYIEAIEYVHILAIRTKVRSLTANLFDPGSLKSAIQKHPYDFTHPEVRAYFLQLSRVLAKQPKHLHALTTPIVWSKAYQFGLDCTQAAAESSKQTVVDLCRANIYQLDTVLEALYNLGNHDEVIRICMETGLETVAKEPRAVRFLVDAADQVAQYDTIESLCTTHRSWVQMHMDKDWHTEQAVRRAAENLSWCLHGQTRSQEAWDMLTILFPKDFTADPKSPMADIYATLKTEVQSV